MAFGWLSRAHPGRRFDLPRQILYALQMTIRRDLDALLDEMEPEYARASLPVDETRMVAAAALRCAYLLADALDAVIQRLADSEGAGLDHELAELKTEIADLRLRVELETDSGRKRRRQ